MPIKAFIITSSLTLNVIWAVVHFCNIKSTFMFIFWFCKTFEPVILGLLTLFLTRLYYDFVIKPRKIFYLFC